ncbi:class III chitinase [Daedaleopsis nitida]|nr:class III chitinase [Daedaleopsis nitida]
MARTCETRTLRAFAALAVGLATSVLQVAAFDGSRFDNVVVYWGQNSYGAVHGDDPANWQKTLSYYCQDDSIDVIPVSFINNFNGGGGKPILNLANTCNNHDNATFAGTDLANCASLATDIKTCQSKGKILTLSIGGGGASVHFESDSDAEAIADEIWNDFLGGSSSTRPFGDAVLDGVDLDIEQGGSNGYAAFVNRLRTYTNGASKKYYYTAAPQCVYPDASLGPVLDAVAFDAVYVQFYNNPCGLQTYNSANGFNFGVWDIWAKNSKNPNVKIYVGAPGSPTAAGGGYQDPATLATVLKNTRGRFPSFGGVMLWDASQAYVNNRYERAAKQVLVAAGGTGFTYPTCSAPAFSSGTAYTANSQVSYNGYIWEAKWWSQNTPSADPNGDWMPISACAGAGSAPSGPTSSTTTAPGSTPTSGSCGGVAAWVATTAYTGGQQATYNGHLWTAKWWTQNETPGSSSGVWTDNGACAAAKQSAKEVAERALKPSRFFRF